MALMNLIYFLLVLCLFALVQSSDNYTTNTLDAFLQQYAFKTLVRHRPQTGALYKAMLPANLSGMDVSIVRLRSRRLWNRGADFSSVHIPPKSVPLPHVKRLALVYQDFGNWSNHYYSVPGYSMITPVIGFTIFDASDVKAKHLSKLGLVNAMNKPIVIRFSNLTLSGENMTRGRCVEFSSNGTIKFGKMSATNMCHSRSQGHFSIVIPLELEQSQKQHVLWYLWVSGVVLGFGGLILIGYLVMVSVKLAKTKNIQMRERRADEDLVLDDIWIGRSKMPYATVTRTQPSSEDGAFP